MSGTREFLSSRDETVEDNLSTIHEKQIIRSVTEVNENEDILVEGIEIEQSSVEDLIQAFESNEKHFDQIASVFSQSLEGLASATSAFSSFLKATAALCPHCVVAVGSMAGSVSSGLGGIPIPLGAHRHEDGTIHNSDHSPYTPVLFPSSQNESKASSHPPSSRQVSSNRSNWSLFPKHMIGIGELFSFRGETMDWSSFLSQFWQSLIRAAGVTAIRA